VHIYIPLTILLWVLMLVFASVWLARGMIKVGRFLVVLLTRGGR
jgi:hypothetical protein